MKATSELMKEHDAILLMLDIMKNVADRIEKDKTVDTGHLEKIIEFVKLFADKCHHGKEEGILFPEMIAKGFSAESGPIAVMLYEHTAGRSHIKSLTEHQQAYANGEAGALASIAVDMRNYMNLLSSHIQKENQILFPMADNVLPAELQDQLYERYEKLEEEVIGRGKHEEFHRLLAELKGIYIKS